AEIRPDVVGISSLFTPYYREVLEVAACGKKRLNVPVIVGGSHASAVPESLLSSTNFDYVIRSEAEKSLGEFFPYVRWQKRIEAVPNPLDEAYDEIVLH